jgi:hypothetical protein
MIEPTPQSAPDLDGRAIAIETRQSSDVLRRPPDEPDKSQSSPESIGTRADFHGHGP